MTDIPLGRGDNAPVPTWQIALDPATVSAFELVVTAPNRAPLTRRSDTGALTVTRNDAGEGTATTTVTWPVLTTESALLPVGRSTKYTLRCYGTAGAVQYTASGNFVITDGPVDPSAAAVAVAGLPGASAYQIAVAHGYAGTEAEWLATLLTADQVAEAVSAAIAAQQLLAQTTTLISTGVI